MFLVPITSLPERLESEPALNLPDRMDPKYGAAKAKRIGGWILIAWLYAQIERPDMQADEQRISEYVDRITELCHAHGRPDREWLNYAIDEYKLFRKELFGVSDNG